MFENFGLYLRADMKHFGGWVCLWFGVLKVIFLVKLSLLAYEWFGRVETPWYLNSMSTPTRERLGGGNPGPFARAGGRSGHRWGGSARGHFCVGTVGLRDVHSGGAVCFRGPYVEGRVKVWSRVIAKACKLVL